jgi:hypothetical protein
MVLVSGFIPFVGLSTPEIRLVFPVEERAVGDCQTFSKVNARVHLLDKITIYRVLSECVPATQRVRHRLSSFKIDDICTRTPPRVEAHAQEQMRGRDTGDQQRKATVAALAALLPTSSHAHVLTNSVRPRRRPPGREPPRGAAVRAGAGRRGRAIRCRHGGRQRGDTHRPILGRRNRLAGRRNRLARSTLPSFQRMPIL